MVLSHTSDVQSRQTVELVLVKSICHSKNKLLQFTTNLHKQDDTNTTKEE